MVLSPALYSFHHSDYSPLFENRERDNESYLKLKRDANRKPRPGRKQKKTHLWHFTLRQRKSKRPRAVPSHLLSGANLIRFGAFCGVRDSRATRCTLRGISHGIFIRSGVRCACKSYTLYPSPLVGLTRSIIRYDDTI